MNYSAVAIAVLILTGCLPGAKIGGDIAASDSQQQNDPCKMARPERRMEIKIGHNQMTSICRADGVGDCLYTYAVGKTFLQARPDLNMDGRDDFLVKDFSGVYGMHDVVHFMGFVSCPGNFAVSVLDDFFTSVRVGNEAPGGQWRQLQVDRACFDERRSDVITREYSIAFDQTRSSYGPPDGNPALIDFCSVTERALPAN